MKIENWKTEFKKLEDAENWDPALELLLKVIEENPEEKDAYIFMHYFFMNLFLEADYYDTSKHDYYESISIKYFKIAYEKYKNDAEYLYWASIPLCHCSWHFGIDDDDEYKRMIEKACFLNPENILYKIHFSSYVASSLNFLQNEVLPNMKNSDQINSLNYLIRKEKLELAVYLKTMNDENSKIRKEVASKGSLGEYFMNNRHFYGINEPLQYKEL